MRRNCRARGSRRRRGWRPAAGNCWCRDRAPQRPALRCAPVPSTRSLHSRACRSLFAPRVILSPLYGEGARTSFPTPCLVAITETAMRQHLLAAALLAAFLAGPPARAAEIVRDRPALRRDRLQRAPPRPVRSGGPVRPLAGRARHRPDAPRAHPHRGHDRHRLGRDELARGAGDAPLAGLFRRGAGTPGAFHQHRGDLGGPGSLHDRGRPATARRGPPDHCCRRAWWVMPTRGRPTSPISW